MGTFINISMTANALQAMLNYYTNFISTFHINLSYLPSEFLL